MKDWFARLNLKPKTAAAGAAALWLILTGWALTAERTLDALDRPYTIYFTADPTGFTAHGWTGPNYDQFACLFGENLPARFCGININLGDGLTQGEDLSRYASLDLTLGYRGPADTMRIFMRHALPPESLAATAKYQNVFTELTPGVYRYRIPLSAFTVPDWWKDNNRDAEDYYEPEFSDVLIAGFDIFSPIPYGLHQFEIFDFQFSQRWLSAVVAPYWALGSLFYFAFSWLLCRQLRLAAELRQRHIEAVGLRHQVTLLDAESARLRHLSMFDPLTQLFNRRAAVDMIETFRQTGGLAGTAVILLDIDHFKEINDTHGHSAGDQVLQELARRILGLLRDSDAAIRWGGEEIVVLCTDVKGTEQAMRIAEKLRQAVAGEKFVARTLAVTASFGVAVCQAGESFNGALERADAALYQAKRNGRNRCVSA